MSELLANLTIRWVGSGTELDHFFVISIDWYNVFFPTVQLGTLLTDCLVASGGFSGNHLVLLAISIHLTKLSREWYTGAMVSLCSTQVMILMS
jgi:hypothetical protein